jgi:hypothetical protein
MMALSGLAALFAFARKSILTQAAVASVILGNLSLVLTAVNDVRGTIPEARLFDVISVGGLMAVAGLALVTLGIALQEKRAPRWTPLTGVVLLLLYLVRPGLVLTGFFPQAFFDGMFTSANMLLSALIYSVQLLMIWGTYRATVKRQG